MFRKFMYGRYGNDNLNNALLVVALVFGFATILTSGIADLIFSLLQLISLVFWAFRAFSRNHFARRTENQKFLEFV